MWKRNVCVAGAVGDDAEGPAALLTLLSFAVKAPVPLPSIPILKGTDRALRPYWDGGSGILAAFISRDLPVLSCLPKAGTNLPSIFAIPMSLRKKMPSIALLVVSSKES